MYSSEEREFDPSRCLLLMLGPAAGLSPGVFYVKPRPYSV